MYKIVSLLSSVLVCSSCSGMLTFPETGELPREARQGAAPVIADTPADEALECLSRTPGVRNNNKVFAVHVINDFTGKNSVEETGAYVPRDVAGMMVTALAKTGIRQVNRVNTAVTEFEIGRAREQILGDGGPVTVGSETVPYRPLLRGQLRGSDYVIDGSLNQLDFNTYSGGAEASLFGVGGGKRVFALTVGADLRVTETKTTQIVKADSYSKQAVGQEVYGSVFRFYSDELYDVKIGAKSQEGLHAGIRWMLAEAAYDIVSELTNHDGSCDRLLPEYKYRVQEAAQEVADAESDESES